MKYKNCVNASGEENRKRKLVDIRPVWKIKEANGMTIDSYLDELRSKPVSAGCEPDTLTPFQVPF